MHYSCKLRPAAVAHWSNIHLTMPRSMVRVLPPLLTQKKLRGNGQKSFELKLLVALTTASKAEAFLFISRNLDQ
jgi:hypothetical protein